MSTVRLHALFSVKGGVGKSSLGIAFATTMLRGGRRPIVIDADLTGTSLADGLDLESPDFEVDSNGAINLLSEPRGYLSCSDTTKRRRKRSSKLIEPGQPAYLSFFNDLLVHSGRGREDAPIVAHLWRHALVHELHILPSSPLISDMALAAAWLFNSETHSVWKERMASLLVRLIREADEVTDIIIDLPPGLFGFTQSVLELLADRALFDEQLPGYTITTNPILLTSEDRNDLFVATEQFASLLRIFPGLRLVANRTISSAARLRETVRARFQDEGRDFGLHQALQLIGTHSDTLGRIFVDGALKADARLEAELLRTLDPESKVGS